MSTASYDKMMTEKKWIERQADAEFAFSESLEAQGVDPVEFMKQWKLSQQQFNTLAHYLHGVNDEEPVLPGALKVLLRPRERQYAA